MKYDWLCADCLFGGGGPGIVDSGKLAYRAESRENPDGEHGTSRVIRAAFSSVRWEA